MLPGRRKIDPELVRETYLKVYLRDSERAVLDGLASELGLTASEAAREAIEIVRRLRPSERALIRARAPQEEEA
jgi:hypothetical protein